MNETSGLSAPLYGIVGNGRLATHMAHYFGLLEIPYKQWSRKHAAVRGGDELTTLHEAMDDCTHVLLLIKDSEIEPFIERYPWLGSKQLVHCSGSVVTRSAVGCHPLYSFSNTPYDLPTYKSIPVVCEAGRPTFNELFPRLPNPWFTIEPELKPYYHALCVLSGNFTTLVWQKTIREFESRLGIPSENALLYLRSIVHNLEHSPGDALTGPIARNDVRTIQSNLEALGADPFVRIYRDMLEIVASGKS